MLLQSVSRCEIPGRGINAFTGVIATANPSGRPRIYADAVLTCRQCEKPFSMRGSEARAYEKKHGRIKPYCSMDCFYEAAHRNKINLNELAPTYVCLGCGQETRRRRDTLHGKPGAWDMRQRFCSLSCVHQHTAKKIADRRATGDYGKGHISGDGYHVVKTAGGKQLRMHRGVWSACWEGRFAPTKTSTT